MMSDDVNANHQLALFPADKQMALRSDMSDPINN